MTPSTNRSYGADKEPSSTQEHVGGRRLVVIGFDGIDPDLVDRWREHLPVLNDWLSDFSCPRLKTTSPPEPAVYWSSFSSALLPEKHHILGSWTRQQASYEVLWGTNTYSPPEFHEDGGLLTVGRATSRRRGSTFWQIAAQAGVSTNVVWVPFAFPADISGQNHFLSGLGVPDLLSTPSTSFILDSRSSPEDTAPEGMELLPLEQDGPSFHTLVPGPVDGSGKQTKLDLQVYLNPDHSQLVVESSGQRVMLSQDQLSEYLSLSFPLGPRHDARALVRFYPLDMGPERVRIYMSPLMPDPVSPFIPFSYPQEHARLLAENYGHFNTMGLASDAAALNANILPTKIFLDESRAEMDRQLALVMGEFHKGDADLFVAILTAPAAIARLASSLYAGQQDDPMEAQILDVYRWMDSAIGQLRASMDPNDILIVFSPAGLLPFRRALDINAWLVERGYLVIDRGRNPGSDCRLDNGCVDWSQSRAYSLGSGQVFLNFVGREPAGTVSPLDREALLADLSREFLHIRDPSAQNAPVVEGVLDRQAFMGGEPTASAVPDLLLVLSPGYQVAPSARAGSISDHVFTDSPPAWLADSSASDPARVQGMILATMPGFTQGASLLDIGPTVLGRLNVPIPATIQGRDLMASLRSGGAVPP